MVLTEEGFSKDWFLLFSLCTPTPSINYSHVCVNNSITGFTLARNPMEDSIEFSVMIINEGDFNHKISFFSLFAMYICRMFVLCVMESSPLGQEI